MCRALGVAGKMCGVNREVRSLILLCRHRAEMTKWHGVSAKLQVTTLEQNGAMAQLQGGPGPGPGPG